MLKALFERHIEGKHVSFHRHVITPEEREEIEKDKQLPYYSTAFVQGAPSLKCINMLNSIRKPRCSDLAGFHIHKWISNEPDVIADIAEGDLASEIDLEKRDLPTTKTLRVLWAATDDKFSFRHSLQLDGFEFTKRNVLRRTASVYDPLGFLSPYVIRSKLLIQKAWLEARDWDELLPTHHQREWTRWFRELKDLELDKNTSELFHQEARSSLKDGLQLREHGF